MFERENLTGILLLVFCAVVAVIMVNAIITGDTPTVPAPLRIPLTVAGILLMLGVVWQRFGDRIRRMLTRKG